LKVALAVLLAGLGEAAMASHAEGRGEFRASRARREPVVDGVADEGAWERASWRPMDQRWLGPEVAPSDYQGRFKVVWTPKRLHLLVEIVDDVLIDRYRDPLVRYWDDDCLEIFLDEDFSGGDHQYSHNAFAYHLSLDNRAIDIGPDKMAREYTHHVQSSWRQEGNTIRWEVAIDVYDDGYREDARKNRRVRLAPGKVLGLMVAWCDNDGSEIRENFMGSEAVATGPTDRGWIDAGIFGKMTLAAGSE
jgi:hypothetical protein